MLRSGYWHPPRGAMSILRPQLRQDVRLAPPPMLIPSMAGSRLLSHLASSSSSSKKKPKTTTTTTTEVPAAVLWFPSNNADCGGSTKGSDSIGTFSILALLMSIFNIINLVASNVNNNNNRNNINDNSGNLNTADNSESNANSNAETATQVMMVPPGVGRRKRHDNNELDDDMRGELLANGTLIRLSFGEDIASIDLSPFCVNEAFLEEVPLGIVMALNAWNVAERYNSTVACHNRNLCELGLNCAVFGPGSTVVGKLAAPVMARWIASNDAEEVALIEAFNTGVALEDCHKFYGDDCQLTEWNNQLVRMKSEAQCEFQFQ